ncbi:MAG: hypothetical protein M9894_15630 [Planctomycetes bacterium]|nr:hypothetical protein [Planctomycetota bacterium]
MMTVETISKRLISLGAAVRQALEAVEGDDDAPGELRRAVQDLVERHREIKERAKAADPRIARELVHLLEAVADRAKHVAEEADGPDESTRQAVRDAHDAISGLEADVDAPGEEAP